VITREQVADLQPGDVVEVAHRDWSGQKMSGPLKSTGEVTGEYVEALRLCGYPIRDNRGEPINGPWTLTVVSRAPRPLYVNHDRAEPVPGDYARDEDADGIRLILRTRGERFPDKWIDQDGIERTYDHIPGRRLRLLVDGETGRALPSEPAPTWCPSSEHHRRMVRSAHAEGWAEGFEAAAEWSANNPGPGGVPHDPPSNPYETGQVVP
jgi:hypothetical protein